MSPCKNCENKGCGAYHSKCQLYLDWKNECYERKKSNRRIDRTYVKYTTFKDRTHRAFACHLK